MLRRRRSRVTSRGWNRRTYPFSTVAMLGFGLALLALLMLVLAPLGTRWGMWDFRFGFTLLRWTVYTGIAAAVVSLFGALHGRPSMARRGFVLALIGIFGGLLAAGIPWQWRRVAAQYPPIHDITTDPNNPPQFSAVLPLRAGAANPPEYAGPEVAAVQQEHYPEIRPLVLGSPPIVGFQRAVAAARSLRWEIVAADEEAGIIEATDRTFWFGFADDVVIRITPHGEFGENSRIDVRSKSRVGRGDVGANARRIRRFFDRIEGRG